MNTEDRIKAFAQLGSKIKNILHQEDSAALKGAALELYNSIENLQYKNPWFTPGNVRQALAGIAFMLQENSLRQWVMNYPDLIKTNREPKKIAVVMAGNIPAVGFHDFLCVLMSGYIFIGKLSDKDKQLPVMIAQLLTEEAPQLEEKIKFTTGKLENFDAIIATGSNNTSRYFEYYFGKHKNIIRKNRNSIAIVNGNETDIEMEALGDDIFSFFGLGCRSISKIYLPEGYNPPSLFEHWKNWDHLKMHSKYMNNYDYQKAILLIEEKKHYDNEFILLRAEETISSPVSTVNYEFFNNYQQLYQKLELQRENIQCVVSKNKPNNTSIPFVKPGHSQYPDVSDYADGTDTMLFLSEV